MIGATCKMRLPAKPMAFALALLGLGCGRILGTDDFRVGESAPAPADSGANEPTDDVGVDLSCLGAVEWTPPSTDQQLPFSLVGSVDSNGYLYPVSGLTVRACYESLPGCGSPFGAEQLLPAFWNFPVDPNGLDRFFGHLETSDPNGVYFDYLFYFFPHPLPQPDAPPSATVGVWKRSDLALALSDVDLDSRLGIVSFTVYDCGSAYDGHPLPPSGGGRAVPGVSASIDAEKTEADWPDPVFFYGYPLTPDPEGQTDVNGIVLIANVPPGHHEVTATVDGVRFGSVEVHVEPDRVTSFHFVPTP